MDRQRGERKKGEEDEGREMDIGERQKSEGEMGGYGEI